MDDVPLEEEEPLLLFIIRVLSESPYVGRELSIVPPREDELPDVVYILDTEEPDDEDPLEGEVPEVYITVLDPEAPGVPGTPPLSPMMISCIPGCSLEEPRLV